MEKQHPTFKNTGQNVLANCVRIVRPKGEVRLVFRNMVSLMNSLLFYQRKIHHSTLLYIHKTTAILYFKLRHYFM